MPEEAWETAKQLRAAIRDGLADEARYRLLALQPILEQPHLTQRTEELLHLEGKVLTQLGREEEARQRQEKLAGMQVDVARLKRLLVANGANPNNPDTVYDILRLYLKLGQKTEAERWLHRLEALSSTDPRLGDLSEELRLLQ
jgi:hypothetical protein